MSQSRNTIRNRISLASGAGDQHSSVGLLGAVLLHAAVIAATFFTWEHRLDIMQESPPVVPVDLVTLAAKTNIIPTVRPERHIEPPKIEEPKPQAPDLVPQPLPKIAAEPAPRDVTPPKPVAKPQPKVKESAADKFKDFLSKFPATAPTPPNARLAQLTHKGFGQQNVNTMDLSHIISNKAAMCWDYSAVSGAPNPDDLVVQFDLFLNPDGSVAQTPHLTADSMARASRNPYTRAAADAAERAILKCAPYDLPADRYAQWREINPFQFDPRAELNGQ